MYLEYTIIVDYPESCDYRNLNMDFTMYMYTK